MVEAPVGSSLESRVLELSNATPIDSNSLPIQPLFDLGNLRLTMCLRNMLIINSLCIL